MQPARKVLSWSAIRPSPVSTWSTTNEPRAIISAGSFVTHFGKQVHWDGAKDEDAVLLIMGEGTATATEVEMTK
jgi:hypothetical protein